MEEFLRTWKMGSCIALSYLLPQPGSSQVCDIPLTMQTSQGHPVYADNCMKETLRCSQSLSGVSKPESMIRQEFSQ